jgi:hypothetical protein
MTLAAVSTQHVGRNPFPIIANPQPEILFVVTDFHFDVLRRRMQVGIAQRLGRKPVNFISKDRMQIARCPFHNHGEVR